MIRTAHPLLRPGISPNKGRLCTVPPQPTNGVRKIHERSCSRPDYSEDCELLEGDALLPGNVMNYSCDPGYKIRGNPFVVCDRSGKWSPIPACVGENKIVDLGYHTMVELSLCYSYSLFKMIITPYLFQQRNNIWFSILNFTGMPYCNEQLITLSQFNHGFTWLRPQV